MTYSSARAIMGTLARNSKQTWQTKSWFATSLTHYSVVFSSSQLNLIVEKFANCFSSVSDQDVPQYLISGSTSKKVSNTAAELLRQGAACNVLYLNSVDTESLTGPEVRIYIKF